MEFLEENICPPHTFHRVVRPLWQWNLDHGQQNLIIKDLKVVWYLYLYQFGQNLAIGSEDRAQTRLFHSIYDPGDREN